MVCPKELRLATLHDCVHLEAVPERFHDILGHEHYLIAMNPYNNYVKKVLFQRS